MKTIKYFLEFLERKNKLNEYSKNIFNDANKLRNKVQDKKVTIKKLIKYKNDYTRKLVKIK